MDIYIFGNEEQEYMKDMEQGNAERLKYVSIDL